MLFDLNSMKKDKFQENFLQIRKNVNIHLIKLIGEEDAKYVLNILGTGDSFQKTICLLPSWFSKSFQNQHKIKNKDLILLGEANFKAWLAYTLYDYLRDGKIEKSKTVVSISLANIYSHTALAIFHEFTKSRLKINYILDLFNTIDKFYIKENHLLHSANSFKDFSRKVSDKSIAAAITAILVVPENNQEKRTCKHLISFFKYYFSARQLSDDLDDYKKDLKLKIKTPATILINQKYTKKNMQIEMRKTIDKNLSLAKKTLKQIPSFDFESFDKLYIKAC